MKIFEVAYFHDCYELSVTLQTSIFGVLKKFWCLWVVLQSSFPVLLIFLSSQWNSVIYICPYLIGSLIIILYYNDIFVQPMKLYYLHMSLPHWFLNYHSLFYWYFCPANETVFSAYVLTSLVPWSSFSIIMIFLSTQWNSVICICPYLIGSSIIIPSFTDISVQPIKSCSLHISSISVCSTSLWLRSYC